VAEEQLQDVDELSDRMAFLDNNLLCPVGEHSVAVFHAAWHGWRQNLKGLAYH
jgi:hypothetical protein